MDEAFGPCNFRNETKLAQYLIWQRTQSAGGSLICDELFTVHCLMGRWDTRKEGVVG
jgi:hypothetical protein